MEKEFVKAWERIKDTIQSSRETLDIVHIWAKNLVRFIGPSLIILWPMYYIIRYRWGALKFDNKYIVNEDALREVKNEEKMDRCKELMLFPLSEEEKGEYKLVPKWKPSKHDLGMFFWQALFMVDMFIIFCILGADFFYTKLIHTSYISITEFFENYNVTNVLNAD